MKKISQIFSIILSFVICNLSFVQPAFAVITNPVLKNATTQATNPTGYFNSFLQVVFSLFFIVGILYFIWHIIFAGYHLIASEGDPKKWDTGKNEIIYATIGLFTMFSIFAILKLAGTILGISGLETLSIKWPSL